MGHSSLSSERTTPFFVIFCIGLSLFTFLGCELRNSFSSDANYKGGDSLFAQSSRLMVKYNCYQCHGQWSEYDVDDDYLSDPELSGNFLPGNGADSNFYKLLIGRGTSGGGVMMPPSGLPMSATEANVIRQWIDAMEELN